MHRIGRTARMGHQGLATSFYNDKNEDIAQDLVNVLVECDCEVPDFLSQYVPEGAKPQFDDDTDDEGDAEADAGDAAAGEAADADGGAPVANLWGAAPAQGGDDGFKADAGLTADGDAGAAGGW